MCLIVRQTALGLMIESVGVSFFQAVGRRDAEDTNNIITTTNASLGLEDITIVDGNDKLLIDTVIDDDIRQYDPC